MVRGKLIRKDNSATFITSEKVLHCNSCNSRITNCDIVFVCQSGRRVYCTCYAEPNTPVCMDSKYKEHWDWRAKMEVEA